MRRGGVALAELDANQKTLIDPLLRSALKVEGAPAPISLNDFNAQGCTTLKSS